MLCKIGWIFDPVRSQRQLHAHLQEGRGKAAPFGKKMLLGIFMRHVSCAGRGWSGDLLIADCEDPENLSASDTGKPHKKESCCVHVLMDLSKLFGLPELPRGELPARRTSRA